MPRLCNVSRLITLLSLVLALPAAKAQQPYITPMNETGFHAFGAYDGASETVSMSNGNLNLVLPLLKFPGRGMDFSLAVEYDSKLYSPILTTLAQPPNQYLMYWQIDTRAPMITPDLRLAVPTLSHQFSLCGGAQTSSTYDFIFTEANGSKHHFGTVEGCSSNPAPILDSDDTSLLRIDPTNANDLVVHLKDGTSIHFFNWEQAGLMVFDQIVDRNGNTINSIKTNGQLTGIVDTVGRTYGVDLTNHKLTYKDANGNSQTITFTQLTDTSGGPITLAHPTGHTSDCPVNVNYSGGNANGGGTVISGTNHTWSINVPDGAAGLTYTLQFDVLDELIKIQYPSGGHTRYDYGAYQALYINPPGNSIACTNVDFREVVAKHECRRSDGNCGTSEDTTTYSAGLSDQTNDSMDVFTPDPSGVPNKTHYTFSIPNGYANEHASVELSRSMYAGSSTLLRTIQTTYTEATRNGQSIIFDGSLPTSITTTYYDITPNITRTSQTAYDSMALYAFSESQLTACGGPGTTCYINNPTEVREYDFGSSLLRRTDYVWNYSGDYAINVKHILDLKSTEKIYDSTSATCKGASNPCSETDYEYDNYTQGIATSGATQLQTETSTRGNLTATTDKLYPGGGSLVTRMQYDDAGNVVSQADPRLNSTSYSFADSWRNTTCKPSTGNAAAYVSRVTDALGHSTSYVHDSCSGLVATKTDPNSQPTNYTFDTLGRALSISFPDSGSTSLSYVDSPPMSITQTQNAPTNIVSTTVMDGLGRVTTSQVSNIYKDTTYDSLGRVQTVTNPHFSTSSPTDGVTTYIYDALGRTCVVVPPGGTPVSGNSCPTTQPSNDVFTVYSGNTTTVTDQAGKSRKSVTDGLGRLIQVYEDPSGLNYLTSYAFDALNNLTSVVQNGSRNRTFVYDSLSRLTSATNPESGTVTYSYDANGNILTKTSPAPNQTGSSSVTVSYCYDSVNELTAKAYTYSPSTPPTCTGTPPTFPSPVATYAYNQTSANGLTIADGIGRRTSMTDASGSEAWSYDPMGRVKVDQRTTAGSGNVTKTTSYVYDLAGNATQVTYPTGRILTYTFDGAGRPATATDSATGTTYATGFKTSPPSGCTSTAVCYAPTGAIYAESLGQTASLSGLNLTKTYNPRLQPVEFKASSTGGNAFDLSYNFIDSSGHNNGNLIGITNNLDATRSQSFTYDSLSRLYTAQTTSTHSTSSAHCWAETYSYDAWGNLYAYSANATTQSAYTGCSQEPAFGATPNAKNQFNEFCYDAAGNLVDIPAPMSPCPTQSMNQNVFDAENHLVTTSGTNYSYDGAGRRVSKVGSQLYWYGSDGNVLAESNAAGGTTAEYIYFGAERIAMIGGPAISNGGFEQGLTGWSTTWGSATVITDPTRAHSGNNYLQLSGTPSGGAGVLSSWVSVTPGEQVTFGGWVYLESGSGNAQGWWLQVADANKNPISYVDPPNPSSSGSWIFQSATYTIPSGAAYVLLYAQNYLPSTNTVVRVDDGFLDTGTTGTTYLYVPDHLGTSRVVTGASGVVLDDSDFYPYGGERSYLSSSGNTYKFTGKERDSESGLDNFGARYYSSSMGRFGSPDEPLIDQDLTVPQSWNLYSYVRDNPLNATDPTGRYTCVYLNDSGNGIEFKDTHSSAQECSDTGGQEAVPDQQVTVTAQAPSADEQRIIDFAGEMNKRPVLKFVGVVAGSGAVIGATGGAACYYLCPAATVTSLGVGTSSEVITGLYGGVTRAALAAAANSGGETVTVITSLDSAPAAMQGLSTATGEGAEALTTAAQPAGQTFTAQIPKALVDLLEKAGLAFPSTTSMGQAGGAVAQEIRFAPEAIQFVAKFFH